MKHTDSHINSIIESCLKKQQSGYNAFYVLFYKTIYNSCLRILKNTMDAEDVMQETFITSFGKLHRFVQSADEKDRQLQLEKWLKRIAINKSINLLKRNNQFVFQEMGKVEITEEIDSSDWEEIQKNEVQIILQAIASLKPKYRVAVSLHLIEGYDYEETAEIMQLSYQNVRTIVSRAKSQLLEILKPNSISHSLSK